MTATEKIADAKIPLFTDFTADNIGTPANPTLPYYAEGQPDARGYVANPAGASYVDRRVAAASLDHVVRCDADEK
jgi:cytochrome c peroxidase